MIDFVLNKELEGYASGFGFSKSYFVNIIKGNSFNEIIKAVNKSSDKLIIVNGDYRINPEILKIKKINILLDHESNVKKDSLHYRNSGLNQVSCKLAAKNKIAIGISFSNILEKVKERSELIGRIMQNVKLCNKYKVKMILGSFARNKYELRGAKDLEAFGRVLGIHKLNNENIFKEKEFTDIEILK